MNRPAPPGAPAKRSALPDISSRARALARGAHVLIADANASTLAVREQQLRDAGLEVIHARTSFEAIVKASWHVPDLILLDGALEEISAAETRKLLTTCPVTAHIPIVQLAAGRRVPQHLIALPDPVPAV